jgi:hypothetical protein
MRSSPLQLRRSNRAEAKAWLLNAIGGLPVADAGARRRRLLQFLIEGSSHRGDQDAHRQFGTRLLHMLFEAQPEKARRACALPAQPRAGQRRCSHVAAAAAGLQVGRLLAGQPELLRSFFEGHPRRARAWFGHFSATGRLSDFKHGAAALARFALARRDEAWPLLAWAGKHPQAPVAVAAKPHYFCELDVAATVDALAARCPAFWASEEVAASVRGGALLAVDPAFFAGELLRWLSERSARSSWLYELLCDFVEGGAAWPALCAGLLPLLGEGDLLRVASRLLDEGRARGRAAPAPAPAPPPAPALPRPAAALVFSGVDWASLEELLVASACACSGPQLLRMLQDADADADGGVGWAELVEGAQLQETPAIHWHLRASLAGENGGFMGLREFLLLHVVTAQTTLRRQAAADGGLPQLESTLQAGGVECALVKPKGSGGEGKKQKKRRWSGHVEGEAGWGGASAAQWRWRGGVGREVSTLELLDAVETEVAASFAAWAAT